MSYSAENPFAPNYRADNPFAPQPTQPEAANPAPRDRTWGEAASDVGVGIAKGGLGMATGLANLTDLATFGAVSGITKGVGGLVDRALGGTGEGYTLQEGANRIDQSLASAESAPLQQRRQRLQETLAGVGQQGGIEGGMEKFWTAASATATDPVLLGQMAAEQVPLLATLGAGTMGTAAKAGAVAEAAGMAPALAQQLGARAATRANIGFSGALGAGYSSQQAAQDILRATPEQLAESPDYWALVESGLSDRDARAELARQAGYPAALVAGPISALTARLTAPMETAAFLGQLPRGIGPVVGAMGREALEEIPQESSEQVGSNLGVRQAGIARDWLEGVPEAAGQAGVAGGLMGAALGGVNVARSSAAPKATPQETQPSGEPAAPPAPELATAPKGLNEPLPDTGPIARAANQTPSVPAPPQEANLGQQSPETTPIQPEPGRPEPGLRPPVGDSAEGAIPAPQATEPAQQTAGPLTSSENPYGQETLPTQTEAAQPPPVELSPGPGSTDSSLSAGESADSLAAPSTLSGPVTQEIPVSTLRLSADVPQFKSEANPETGVVEPLGGKYERVGTAPIIVWERANGQQEVISGRHRLDLARRSGEQTIPAQVLREADGFTAQQASILDAELNIRDGQGKVKDYVNYFQHAGLSQEEANLRGLVSRSIGQRAFAIANEGAPGLIAAHRADRLTDDAAFRIAKTAPSNERIQAVGIKAVQDGKTIATATNLMQAVKSLGMADSTIDMFGFDDSAMRQAESMARIASRHQRQLGEQLAAVQGAAKRPEQARALGVDVADPAAVRAKIAEIKTERDAWETWSTNPDLVAQIRQEAEAQNPRASVATGAATNPAETARALAAHPDVQRLGDRITVVERQAALRPELLPKDGGPVKAVIDRGKIVLVGEHWTAEDLARMEGVLQHEGGVHLARDSGFYDPIVQAAGKVLRAVGLKSLAGESSWNDVTRQFQALVKNQNSTAQRAHELARAALGKDADANPDLLAEEAIGYLAELNHKHSLIRRLAATVKAVLYRMGVKVTLDDAALVALARAGLRRVANAPIAASQTAEPRYSRPHAWADNLPAEVGSMADKIGAEPKGLRERLQENRATLPTRLRAGLVDRFARLLELDRERFGRDVTDTHTALSAWVAAKMSKSPAGALEGAFLHGRLKWEDGALNVQETKQGLAHALEPIASAGELNRFWQWIIAHRSERLLSEGRERLFTPAEIAAGKQLNEGQMAGGASRNAVYRKAFARYVEIQKSVLDVAQQAGLFDAQQRAQWEHDFYLPYYRVIEDEGVVRGPSTGGGKLVRQKAFEKLKGGAEKLGDPLQNILRNWHHLIDASLKNRAAILALDTAAHLGIAKAVPEAQTDKNSVWVMQAGQKTHYNVSDPLTLDALSALHAPLMDGAAIRALAAAKRALTLGVTISPAFKMANLLRDSIAALAVSRLDANVFKLKPLTNPIRGFLASKEGSATQAALLTGGGTFRFGTLLEGDSAAAARRIAGFKPDTVLNSPEKIKGLFDTLKSGLDAWNRFGDRLETANRAALYAQLRQEGKTHLQAALAARDLMDFSQSGAWPATRFLINMVPFLNARIQGLDVLYRKGFKPMARAAVGKASAGEKQQALRFAATTFMVGLASTLLYLTHKDDEDFKAREQWDRDTYWWFKLGGTAYRIPKPFEVGALGTIAERIAEQIVDQEATGQLFAERLGHMLGQTFAFDPTPQLVKPALEVYANRSTFTGRPIETLDMERLSPELRRRYSTSALAIGASEAGLGRAGVSPVQIEHLIRGYFGWLGTQALLIGDYAARPAMGLPERPAKQTDIPLIGDLLQRFAPDGRSSRYVTEFYDQLQQVRQIAADARLFERLQDPEALQRHVAQHGKALAQAAPMEQVARAFAELGQAERRIGANRTMSGLDKQARIDELTRQKSLLAQRALAALRR